MLNSIDHWGVDIFNLATLTNNRPLTTMTYKIFQVKNGKQCGNSIQFTFGKNQTINSYVLNI